MPGLHRVDPEDVEASAMIGRGLAGKCGLFPQACTHKSIALPPLAPITLAYDELVSIDGPPPDSGHTYGLLLEFWTETSRRTHLSNTLPSQLADIEPTIRPLTAV